MNLFFLHNNKGIKAFTLLEVLASLAIITLVILGPLTFAVNSSSFARQTKDVMVSTYLAEEMIELLHHQYDTLYLACVNDKDACQGQVLPNETPSNTAWRLFKTRLNGGGSGVSCFNNNGCSFDFLDLLNTTNPAFYDPSNANGGCPMLSLVSSFVTGIDTSIRNYYVCSGISLGSSRLKDDELSVKKTTYTRKITIQSKNTFETGFLSGTPNLGLYNDDLLITATVSFRKFNRIIRSVNVTDFLHSRS